jgi:hypothetical protein
MPNDSQKAPPPKKPIGDPPTPKKPVKADKSMMDPFTEQARRTAMATADKTPVTLTDQSRRDHLTRR